jgi:hypothetical protein
VLDVRLSDDTISVGERFTVQFQRTLRVPDDGREYPLPPGLGQFPVLRVSDFARWVPADWEQGDFFIPMYQREALWLLFGGAEWKPNAVMVAVGRVNALTGDTLDFGSVEGSRAETGVGITTAPQLRDDPQNYVVCPVQPWLDGIHTESGRVRQFVAMPLGGGHTVEGQLTGQEQFGGIQLVVYEPKEGRFPDKPPPQSRASLSFEEAPPPMQGSGVAVSMGLGAGGNLRQKVYPDPYGLDTWDRGNWGRVVVHIVNSHAYRSLTGQEPPPTPVNAAYYTDLGLPWFDLYDEEQHDIGGSERMAGVKTVSQHEREAGTAADSQDEASIEIDSGQVKRLSRQKTEGESEGR